MSNPFEVDDHEDDVVRGRSGSFTGNPFGDDHDDTPVTSQPHSSAPTTTASSPTTPPSTETNYYNPSSNYSLKKQDETSNGHPRDGMYDVELSIPSKSYADKPLMMAPEEPSRNTNDSSATHSYPNKPAFQGDEEVGEGRGHRLSGVGTDGENDDLPRPPRDDVDEDRVLHESGYAQCSWSKFCCSTFSICLCGAFNPPGYPTRANSFRTMRECAAHWGAVMLGTLLPLIIAFIVLRQHEQYTATKLQQFLLALATLLWIALMLSGVNLLSVTNEGSISGMVAQRYNRAGYFATLTIVSIAWSTSLFIVMGGILREAKGEAVTHWVVVVGTLSPLVTSLILIFPIVVVKTPNELLMEPIDAAVYKGKDDHGNKLFAMYFHRWMDDKWHSRLHGLCVFVGVVLGYIAIIHSLTQMPPTSAQFSLCVSLLVLSMVSISTFFIGRMFCGKNKRFFTDGLCCSLGASVPDRVDRWMLLAEFLGLAWYMLGLTISNAITAGFIQDRQPPRP